MTKKKYNRKVSKDNYISTKNAIRESAEEFGGLFYTHQFIAEDTQFVDYCFMGKKERIYWNADIVTAKLAYADKIHDLAIDELNAILGDDWQDNYPIFKEVADEHGCIDWEPIECEPIKELGNVTWPEWFEKKQRELADSGTVFVEESSEVDYLYEAGRGLHVVVNADVITIDTINESIKAFMANGEQPVESGKPLTFKANEIDWKTDWKNAIA